MTENDSHFTSSPGTLRPHKLVQTLSYVFILVLNIYHDRLVKHSI